jgi:hypothetical protein
MLYTVVLHIDVTDEAALVAYVKTIVIPEYCKQPEKVTTVPTSEVLHWLYNCGTSFAGTEILNASITRIDEMPAYRDLPEVALTAALGAPSEELLTTARQTAAPAAFNLPAFVPW